MAFFRALCSDSGGCRGTAKQKPKRCPLLLLLPPYFFSHPCSWLPPNGPDSFRDSLGIASQTLDDSCLSLQHMQILYQQKYAHHLVGRHPLSHLRAVSRGQWSQEEFFCQTLMREAVPCIEVRRGHHHISLSLIPTHKVPNRDNQMAVSSRGPRFVYSVPEESMYIPKRRPFAALKALRYVLLHLSEEKKDLAC